MALPSPGRGRLQPDGNPDPNLPSVAPQALGWFRGESGWVRITEVGAGRIAGEFEIRARGFTREHPEDEDQWVAVRGKFEAREEEVGVVLR